MKRIFDILFSCVLLVLLSPILLVLALAVTVESKGGIFYLQTRVGKNNHEFKIFKFRTMYTGSDKKGLITVGDRDPRVTKVGAFIRKYKFDELPQLINVLLGDMSVVGPRPEVRKYVELYTPEQLRVLSVKPGITDYASIEYMDENEILAKSNNPDKTYIEEIMPAKLNLNLKYISEQSFLGDMKLIFNTLLGILGKRDGQKLKAIKAIKAKN